MIELFDEYFKNKKIKLLAKQRKFYANILREIRNCDNENRQYKHFAQKLDGWEHLTAWTNDATGAYTKFVLTMTGDWKYTIRKNSEWCGEKITLTLARKIINHNLEKGIWKIA